MAGWFTRAIRPPPGDDPGVAQASVGEDVAVPGDPHGVLVDADPPLGPPLPRIVPSPWSGWPSQWSTPNWDGHRQALTDTAWMCIDLNASLLATMPPYLVGAAPSLDADWLNNPDPALYTSWEEFAKALFWDFHLGEVFVLATARYSTGWPARFHVVEPWMVTPEMDGGTRRYLIGTNGDKVDVTADMLHIRYQSTAGDPHGHGPLEAGGARMTAADVLTRYATNLAAGGGIPAGTLEHPEELTAQQSLDLKAQWVNARMSGIGEPAVLSGGVKWSATQVNPTEMALIELLTFNEGRIANLLGVPPFLVGLPSGGDPMTYSNVTSIFSFHWRASLRPKASTVMAALSQWLLPRGTQVEVNRDAYIQPEPLVRAQTAEILNRIRDEQGSPVMTVDMIRAAERLDQAAPDELAQGVLR